MKDRIQILREKVVALASQARQLKCEAEDKPAVEAALESVEDFLDYAVDKLNQAAAAVDAQEAF